MKKNKYSTISVMTKTQKAVKANSEKRGMTQSEYVDRAVTDFERNAKFKARRKADLNLEDMTYEEILAFVATSLSALSKRNDVSHIFIPMEVCQTSGSSIRVRHITHQICSLPNA